MKRITHKGKEYEAVIIDGNIVLQSLEQDVVFEKGYNNVCAELEKEWWSAGAIGSSRDYVLEYEQDAILDYIKNNEGVTLVNNNN